VDVEQEKLKTRLQQEAAQGKLPCRKAFTIAGELDCPPAVIGEMCDELKVKISGCQLGCF
jgi:hypothetical protein